MKRLLPLLLLCAPGALAAQTTTLSSYVAADAAVTGNPVLLGVTVGRKTEHLGLRWGAAVDARSTFAGSDRVAAGDVAGLLTTEVDGQLFLGGALGDLGFDPYALGGVGLRMVRDDLASGAGGTWSYGVGARKPVAGWLALEAEARHREPIGAGSGPVLSHTAPGWEFRVGAGLGFGRSRPATRVAPLPAVPLSIPRRAVSAPAGVDGVRAARLRVASGALDTARELVGVRYTWGGNTPAEGFDCSGFVRYVFRAQGIDLPRVSRDQALAGEPLPLAFEAFEPGDILAFASDGRTVDHIAIYAGEGRIVHSSNGGRGVRVDDISGVAGGWYRQHMVAARRVIPGGGSLSSR